MLKYRLCALELSHGLLADIEWLAEACWCVLVKCWKERYRERSMVGVSEHETEACAARQATRPDGILVKARRSSEI